MTEVIPHFTYSPAEGEIKLAVPVVDNAMLNEQQGIAIDMLSLLTDLDYDGSSDHLYLTMDSEKLLGGIKGGSDSERTIKAEELLRLLASFAINGSNRMDKVISYSHLSPYALTVDVYEHFQHWLNIRGMRGPEVLEAEAALAEPMGIDLTAAAQQKGPKIFEVTTSKTAFEIRETKNIPSGKLARDGLVLWRTLSLSTQGRKNVLVAPAPPRARLERSQDKKTFTLYEVKTPGALLPEQTLGVWLALGVLAKRATESEDYGRIRTAKTIWDPEIVLPRGAESDDLEFVTPISR